jgi:CRISPR-associated protein Cas5d
MYCLIDAVRIVRKSRWFSFRRNEVKKVISGFQSWMESPEKVSYIEANDNDTRTQRNMLALQDVEYLITAEVCLSDLGKDSPHGLPKYLSEIERRVRGGKCFHRHCLGVREFAADFDWIEDAQAALEKGNPDWMSFNDDPGLMLYDPEKDKDNEKRRRAATRITLPSTMTSGVRFVFLG